MNHPVRTYIVRSIVVTVLGRLIPGSNILIIRFSNREPMIPRYVISYCSPRWLYYYYHYRAMFADRCLFLCRKSLPHFPQTLVYLPSARFPWNALVVLEFRLPILNGALTAIVHVNHALSYTPAWGLIIVVFEVLGVTPSNNGRLSCGYCRSRASLNCSRTWLVTCTTKCTYDR